MATEPKTSARAFAAHTRDEMFRDLVEEPARRVVIGRAEQHPAPGVAQVEAFLRAGDADVTEAALFFEFFGFAKAAEVREHTVFHPDEEHDRELESLGRVQR